MNLDSEKLVSQFPSLCSMRGHATCQRLPRTAWEQAKRSKRAAETWSCPSPLVAAGSGGGSILGAFALGLT